MRFSSLRSIGIGCAVLGLAGTALVASAPAAHAQGQVTFNFTPTVNNRLTDFTQAFTANKFDGSLGKLIGIRFTFATGITTDLTITNNAATTASGTLSTSVVVTLTDPGNYFPTGTSPLFLGQSGVNRFTTTSDGYDYSLAPGETQISGPLTGSSSSNGNINGGTANSASIFAEFTGGPTDTISVSGKTTTLTNNSTQGGNFTITQTTTADISGTVTYFYTPEPGTLSLIGSGLLVGGAGFGGQIRRRRRAAKNQA